MYAKNFIHMYDGNSILIFVSKKIKFSVVALMKLDVTKKFRYRYF